MNMFARLSMIFKKQEQPLLPGELKEDLPGRGQYFGIFFLAFAALAFEIMLTRILSYRYWYHYASLIIAIAMLGNGIAGTLASFFNKRGRETRFVLFFLALLFAVCVPYVVQLSNIVQYNPNLYNQDSSAVISSHSSGLLNSIKETFLSILHSFRGSDHNTREQVKLYLLFMFPFLIVGVAMTFAFSAYQRSINKFYFSDLSGAGLGVLTVLLLMPYLGLEKFVWLIGMFGGISAIFFASRIHKLWTVPAVLVTIFLALPVFGVLPHHIDIPTTKANKKEMRVFAEYWDNIARISLWHRNDNYITINMDWSCLTIIQHHSMGLAIRKKLYENHFIPFVLRPDGSSCIVGSGGGRDINAHLDMHELYGKDKNNIKVYAVELNPTMVKLLKSTNAFSIPGVMWNKVASDINITNILAYSGNLAKDPRVEIINDEGRNFIRSHKMKYDLIVQNNAYTFAAVSSGAFSLAENYLMTVEAFEEYYDHLKPGGILYFSRPYFEAVRMASVAREFFTRRGMLDQLPGSVAIFLNPDKRGYNVQQFYLKKGRFTREEIEKLNKLYRQQAVYDNFPESVVVYAPFLSDAKWDPVPISQNDQIKLNNSRHVSSIILAPDEAAMKSIYDQSLTDIRPPRDNWPFFSQRAKWEDFLDKESPALKKIESFFPQSIMSIRQALVVVFFIAMFFIVIPLFFVRSAGLGELGGKGIRGILGKLQFLYFFAMLGLGFMFIEIHMMQKLGLVFGTPVIAIAYVLSGMLVFSGIGSFLTGAFKNHKRSLAVALVLVLGVLGLYLLFGDNILRGIMGAGMPVRILVSSIFVFPLAIGMGMMFPSAVSWISDNYPRSIAWGWAVNGFSSVLASLLANIISVFLGLSSLIWFAAFAYLSGILLFCFIKKRTRDEIKI